MVDSRQLKSLINIQDLVTMHVRNVWWEPDFLDLQRACSFALKNREATNSM